MPDAAPEGPTPTTLVEAAGDGHPGASLHVREGMGGLEYEIAIVDGAIRATDLAQIRPGDDGGPGLLSYDPALMNTASCRSAITYIDGDHGILLYRGYPIGEVAGQLGYLDTAHLLIEGEIPDDVRARAWEAAVAAGSPLPDPIGRFVETFPSDAHPMAVLLAAWSALGAYRPEAKAIDGPVERRQLAPGILGSFVSVAGLVIRHRTGHPNRADGGPRPYRERVFADLVPDRPPHPELIRALEILLILQADHEQNCSTNAVRAVGSSRVDPYSATAAGVAALYGPLHGGANEAVIRMLHEIGETSRVPAFIESVKRGDRRLMGFGHRIYKSYDPRAAIIKETAGRVFEVTGINPLVDVAVAIEQVALRDPYFIDRRLYPNVDFYSGLIYEAMGLPADTNTVLFAVGRMAGWLAHWLEGMDDPEQKIVRPRQLYTGPAARSLADAPTVLARRQASAEGASTTGNRR